MGVMERVGALQPRQGLGRVLGCQEYEGLGLVHGAGLDGEWGRAKADDERTCVSLGTYWCWTVPIFASVVGSLSTILFGGRPAIIQERKLL